MSYWVGGHTYIRKDIYDDLELLLLQANAGRLRTLNLASKNEAEATRASMECSEMEVQLAIARRQVEDERKRTEEANARLEEMSAQLREARIETDEANARLVEANRHSRKSLCARLFKKRHSPPPYK